MKKKGVALIVVLVIIILFASLILAVVLSSTMAIRKAHYYTDKTLALEIAESGLQTVLNKMNYEKYGNGSGHQYPFGINPTGTNISEPSIQGYYPPAGAPSNLSYTAYDTDIDVSYYGPEADCDARLIDANLNVSDPTSYDTDLDLLVVTGKYKGKTAKIMCRIRGSNQAVGDLDGTNYNSFTPPRTQGSCGVAEAFNKHVIYTEILGGNGTVTIKGNGTYTTYTGSFSLTADSEATWTETTNTSIPVLSDDYKPVNPINLEPSKPTATWDKRFKDDDGSDGGTGTYTPASSPPYEAILPAGVSYSGNGTNETYTISSGTISENWIFEKADTSSTLTVIIQGNTALSTNFIIKAGKDGVPAENADIVLDFSGSNNPDIRGKLVAERDIKIENVGVSGPNQIGTTGDISLWAGRDILIDYTSSPGPVINGNIRGNDIYLKCAGNKVEINGNIYGVNTVNFQDNLNTVDGFKVNGDVTGINGVIFSSANQGKNIFYSMVSKSSMTIPDNSNFSLSIDSTNSERKAGILIYQESNATLSIGINSDIDLTIGDNQICGIMVYFDNVSVGGSNKISNITIGAGINFSNPASDKFLIINRSEDGSITINAPGKTINGSIYSAYYKDTTPSITLTNGTLTGSIFTNGTVNLNGGEVNFDPLPYKNAPGDIYKGFVGGRRVYLPVPKSWRVEW